MINNYHYLTLSKDHSILKITILYGLERNSNQSRLDEKEDIQLR